MLQTASTYRADTLVIDRPPPSEVDDVPEPHGRVRPRRRASRPNQLSLLAAGTARNLIPQTRPVVAIFDTGVSSLLYDMWAAAPSAEMPESDVLGSWLDTTPTTADWSMTRASSVPSFRERLKSRLRMLRRLPANHDGEGASAPVTASVDACMVLLNELPANRNVGVTLNDDGLAVIECEDRDSGYFADITFLAESPVQVECYRNKAGEASRMFTGKMEDPEVQMFLAEVASLTA